MGRSKETHEEAERRDHTLCPVAFEQVAYEYLFLLWICCWLYQQPQPWPLDFSICHLNYGDNNTCLLHRGVWEGVSYILIDEMKKIYIHKIKTSLPTLAFLKYSNYLKNIKSSENLEIKFMYNKFALCSVYLSHEYLFSKDGQFLYSLALILILKLLH